MWLLSSVIIKCSNWKPPKRGYCVPSLCQSDGNCPKLGDECTSGSLTGTCNPRNTCEYNQLLAIASCGKEIQYTMQFKLSTYVLLGMTKVISSSKLLLHVCSIVYCAVYLSYLV